MNSMDFTVFCHCLYSHMQNGSYQDEISELFKQADGYINNSILLKHKQAREYRKPRQEEIFEKFINYIKQYCSLEHSVKFYADKLCISSQYLSKISKDISGRTANEWIDEFVFLEAKTLLAYTNLTIQEISINIGFADQSSFGKFFKRNSGLSPREYLQKHV